MYGHNAVHSLSTLPVNDGNFTSALNRANDDEIAQAIKKMESDGGPHKGRITACQRELRKREKKKLKGIVESEE